MSGGFDGNNKSKVHTHNYCDSYPLLTPPPTHPPPSTHTARRHTLSDITSSDKMFLSHLRAKVTESPASI